MHYRLFGVRVFYLLPVAFLLVLALSVNAREMWQLNVYAHTTAQLTFRGDISHVHPPPYEHNRLFSCRYLWLDVIRRSRRNISLVDQAEALLRSCSSVYVIFLHALMPQQRRLAESAVRYQPGAAFSWFWLAEVKGRYHDMGFRGVSKDNWEEIAALLRRGLALAPHDGLRWRLLGDVLRPYAPQQAIDAYLNSCFNGDPGYNGCYRAGLMAEELGDYRSAIRYYCYSRWAGARERG